MGKKVNLPLFSDTPSKEVPKSSTGKRPSIEVARTKLGGRMVATTEAAPFPMGAPVCFGSKRTTGVVVFASSTEVHVLLDGVRLRRLPPASVERYAGELTGELTKIAADARLFGMLLENQSVRYVDDSGGLTIGKIVEKCRWGALVLRDDGAVVAVGFRKLWPVSASGGMS